jgi:transposase
LRRCLFLSTAISYVGYEHGHRILRSPPHHPEFNPIEKIWAQLKNWVATRNITFKINDVIEFAREKFSMATRKEQAKVCGLVDEVVVKYIDTAHRTLVGRSI